VSHESGQSISESSEIDRLSGFVAIIIAFATLIAALAGFLQADASNQAGDRRDQAEQLSLKAMASAQSAQEDAQVNLQTFERYAEQRTQSGNALLASLYAGGDQARADELRRESDRWSTLASSTLKLTNIAPTGDMGPEKDPAFPRQYFTNATEESLRLNALEDAANEAASLIDERAAAYTAILATLAVSLYLFGLTLAVSGRRMRLGFFVVGLVLLGVGTVWMAETLLLPGVTTNDAAATEYAKARVASLTAVDSTGFQEAEKHYDTAIQLRPTFARAYAERAAVIFDAASPQRTGYVSIAPPAALEKARADLEHALSLGLENASTMGDLGFYSFSEGIQSGDLNLLNSSITYTQRAIALDPGEPLYRYNLGVALAASGRIGDAQNAYNDAVLRTLFIDPALTQLRNVPSVEEFVVAAALTDLEIARKYRPDLDTQLQSLKEQIVGRVAAESKDPPPQSPATFSDLQLDVFPATAQWQGNLANYDPARDTISAQWYHQDPQGLGWAVIPEISITAAPTQGTDGRYFIDAPYLSQTLPAQCLPAGQYRAEIYINGRRAAEGSVQTTFSDAQAFLARDLTAALCRPPDWVRRADAIPGLIDGFNSTDSQYGVYIARYGIPGTLRSLPDLTPQMEDLTIQAFGSWFPAQPKFDETLGTTSTYFEALSSPAWRWYDYGTGLVEVGAGVTADGAVALGMVYGPYDWFKTAAPGQILDSMIHIE